ncbi:CDP-alcohol phosphatidyltransferase family protein [uncultured Thioclava sp.]|uniref:CDP-alcohol phosphatidyltransferase family protein n=1 Tax=uncultured Thioclava sp. TaxID=473858 RepID=UPI0025DB8CF2|nr:CDP-alcohol phosphatidyltransferase family protein [uncultured Thioclava sp.]
MTTPLTSPDRMTRLMQPLGATSPSGAWMRLLWLALPLGVLCAALAARLAPSGAAVSVGLFVAVTALAAALMRRRYAHPRLGLCNTVTLTRAALACALVAPLAGGGFATTHSAIDARWLSVIIATIALAMDGLDGWLARRSGLSSAFGARFDMEVDAALGLILSLLVVASGTLGIWVLALGTMRYAYVLAGLFLPWLNAPLPERFRRKALCVVQIGALIMLLIPGLGALGATLIATSATLALAGSFGADILWLARRRRT